MKQIQDLKEKVGQSAEQIISDGLKLERKGKKYHCPNGVEHKNGDRSPSMSWDPKALQMFCFACGFKIDIYTYSKEYEYLRHGEIMRNYGIGRESNYEDNQSEVCKSHEGSIQQEFNICPLTNIQKEYLRKRGIQERLENVFQLGDAGGGNLAIPYIDEQGKVVGVKVRILRKDASPKYISYPESEFGFYNKQNISAEDRKQLIITEGEFDCMILNQIGFNNAVSVGCGANSLNALLEKEDMLLRDYSSLIVLADNDKAGRNMSEIFSTRFGTKVKLPNIDLFYGYKDLSEVYLERGMEALRAIVTSASVKIEGWRDLDTAPYKGVSSLSEGRYISTGLPSIDYGLNDLGPGMCTLITGRSNAGKSCLVDAIMVNAIDKGNKVLLVAGEGLPELRINNLYKAIIGRSRNSYDVKKINKRHFIEPKKEVLVALRKWHEGKFTLFNKGESNLKTMEEFFELLKGGVKNSRPNLLVIDNLMSCLSVEKASEKTERQADFMQRCCDLAKSENIHIILVVHPNKTLLKGSHMEFEQISGSSDLYNKADNIIAVSRNYSEDIRNKKGDGEIHILKNRYHSDLTRIRTVYNTETGMLEEFDEKTGRSMTNTLSFQNPYNL